MAGLDHALRSKGIGSSEIAMLVIGEDGKPLSPWGGPHKLWRQKTGQEIEKDPGERPWLDRGHALEGWILSRYAQLTGARLRKSPGTKQSKKFPLAVDSVDALAWMPGADEKPSCCVEAKAPLMFSIGEWGEKGTDQIPQQYLLQGQWHMGVWELTQCDYPIDGTGDVKIYTTHHDEELWQALLQIAEKFWTDHVLTGVAPPVDASDATSEWLSKRLKQNNEDILDADAGIVKKMQEYRTVRLRYDADKKTVERLANELKEAIGERKGLCLPGEPKAKITFNSQKNKAALNQGGVIDALYSLIPEEMQPDMDELRSQFTRPAGEHRVFRPAGLLKHGGES